MSALGTSTSGIAFSLLVLGLTGSPFLAGVAGGISALPAVLLNIPAGVVVDRWAPKRLMILCDAARAIAMGSIPLSLWSGHLSLAQLYAVAFVGGAMQAIYNTAVLVVLPRVVTTGQLATSSAQYEGSYYAVGLAGPSLGGVVYGIARAAPFLMDSASYLLSILSVILIRTRLQTAGVGVGSLRGDAGAGLRWFWSNRLIRSVSILEGGEVLLLSGTSLLVIVLARSQHASSGAVGLALSIGAGGGILGAIASPGVQRLLDFQKIMVGVQWVRVVLYPLYAVAPNPIVAGMITAAIYFVNPVRNAALFRYAVPLVPDDLRGRVLATWDLIPSVVALVGAPLMGEALAIVGPERTAVAAGVVGGILALAMTLNPHIRHVAGTATATPGPESPPVH